MMMVPNVGLMARSIPAIVGGHCFGMPTVVIACVEGYDAERKMLMIGGHSSLMLNAIDDTSHARARKNKRQRDAKHRAKP